MAEKIFSMGLPTKRVTAIKTARRITVGQNTGGWMSKNRLMFDECELCLCVWVMNSPWQKTGCVKNTGFINSCLK
jgi:hypothetical protein